MNVDYVSEQVHNLFMLKFDELERYAVDTTQDFYWVGTKKRRSKKKPHLIKLPNKAKPNSNSK